jgi:isopentenyl diphosphate isomerase/L-lactate dehydrogenase-like FMN-dependent dehydrogenase
MTTTRAAERQAISDAIERMITGTPARSTGALTVLQLANEAGVKRWVLTHKHPDLKEEFEQRRAAANGIPAAFQSVHARSVDLETANRQVREENVHLTERIEVYAQVIAELSTRVEQLQFELTRPDNVRRLPLRTVDRT